MLVNGTRVLEVSSLRVNILKAIFGRLFRREPAPLTGAPRVRRVKSYSAASGYVYQYFYAGQRAARRTGAHGAEYVFEWTAGREACRPVSVFLPARATAAWEAGKGRALLPAERYAIAKMSLFRAFDERESPALIGREIAVRADEVDAILAALGVE